MGPNPMTNVLRKEKEKTQGKIQCEDGNTSIN